MASVKVVSRSFCHVSNFVIFLNRFKCRKASVKFLSRYPASSLRLWCSTIQLSRFLFQTSSVNCSSFSLWDSYFQASTLRLRMWRIKFFKYQCTFEYQLSNLRSHSSCPWSILWVLISKFRGINHQLWYLVDDIWYLIFKFDLWLLIFDSCDVSFDLWCLMPDAWWLIFIFALWIVILDLWSLIS